MNEKILAGRYRLVEQIGVGGMAIVFRAIDQNTGHNVAIKVLKPEYNQNAEFVGRFQREAAAASKMTHHNIVNLLDVGMDGENRYLVMEYVEGRTLKQLIQERGKIPYEPAAQIAIRILSALQHAHENGIIHRDIKPQNILVNAAGHVKVSDFGIARMADSATLTTGDSVMGSVHYFSPEQARGQTADERSDIYSVGVCLYEMLTGRVPFDGESTVAIAMQHIQSQPTPIETLAPEVPAAYIHVCMMAMEKNPEYRYQTAYDMATELRKALAGRVYDMKPRIIPREPGAQTKQNTGANRSGRRLRAAGKNTGTAGTGRRRIVRTITVLLMTAIVITGLYIGGMMIYDRVVNSATVPDMLGMELSAAERTAARQGLNTAVVEVYSTSTAAGYITMQAPEADTPLRKGDTVVLTVSKGVSARSVPQITGCTLTDAQSVLQAYSLTLQVTERVVSTEQPDTILTQYPETGADCQAGDVIQVTVSGGSAFIPNLSGKSLAAAEDLLVSSGLARSATLRYAETQDASQHGTVADQSPAAGLQVVSGTKVTLTLWRVPSLAHTAVVTLELPASDTAQSVRVDLSNGETDVTQWQAEIAPDAARDPALELNADSAGIYTYKVYINDKFAYQQQLTLE